MNTEDNSPRVDMIDIRGPLKDESGSEWVRGRVRMSSDIIGINPLPRIIEATCWVELSSSESMMDTQKRIRSKAAAMLREFAEALENEMSPS